MILLLFPSVILSPQISVLLRAPTVIVCYLLTVVGLLGGNCALKSGPLSYEMKRSLSPGPWSLCVD